VPQVPVVLQVSTPPFAHWTEPGEQTPVHAPFTHACAVQGTGVPQVLDEPQACTALPEHWT
jgi:hypothetical protein